jgi:hypothetical protein
VPIIFNTWGLIGDYIRELFTEPQENLVPFAAVACSKAQFNAYGLS